MHRLALFTLSLLVACAIFGCKAKPAALLLSDSEGRSFQARCGEGGCEVTGAAGPVSLVSHGRLVAVCPAGEAGPPAAPATCRALVCSADTACPPAHGLEHGTCINGLCVEPSQEIISDDAVMLCLAGTGPGHSTPTQVERAAIGLNCGNPCRVPRNCRQP